MDEQNVERPRRMRRALLWLVGLALVALVVIVASQPKESVEEFISPLRAKFWDVPSAVDDALRASGIIQVQEVYVASEFGGRIADIVVAEGDSVSATQVLVQLDTTLLDAQVEVAQAAVAVAQAGLAQAQAGARPGQVAIAQAQLNQAEAARVAATQAVSDTLALVENPQDIRLQIAVTYAQAEAAQYQVAQAEALKDAAQVAKDEFENARDLEGSHKAHVRSGPVSELPGLLPPEIVELLPTLGDGVHNFGNLELHLHGGTYDLYTWINVSLPLEFHLTPNQWWQAWVNLNAATARQKGLQSSLGHLYAQKEHPQSLEAQADTALAALAQAEAQVAVAQAQVDGLKAGATQEQIVALRARVGQAQSVLDSLLVQRGMMTITSPQDGAVIDLVAHRGEVAASGAALLTLADLSQVHLTVYLPETQIGRVYLGQKVQVAVDSFPGRVFTGQVSHIADRAEFTPRNVATRQERVHLVFAVEIRLPNEDGALKPGMPADAVFEE
ncbi:MAG: efflux RND transporter periplasmic adaptor subunit [Anaerolineae bacterium]